MIRSTAEISPFDIPLSRGPAGANIKPHPSVADRGLVAFGKPPYLRDMMLDLTDAETDALAGLLSRTIDDDWYPLSPARSELKGHFGEDPTRAGTRALAAAEGLWAAASEKQAPRLAGLGGSLQAKGMEHASHHELKPLRLNERGH
jgi:hypothetical protein